MGHILKIKPVFKEMIWGGHKLRDVYGYDIPSVQTGECWAISAHKNGDCVVEEGEYKGKSLSWLFENHRELFGNMKGEQFPLLVKIIDAKDNLSVQVHPDDAYAKENENSLGKTECWYVLHAETGAKMVLGTHAKTKREFKIAIVEDDYENLLNTFGINKGEFYYIPSGTLHAICKGSLIYEVQQSSDITYRVYDYHRKDKDGFERQLHLRQAIDVTDVTINPLKNTPPKKESQKEFQITSFVKNEFFTVKGVSVKGTCKIANNGPFLLLSVLEGEGSIQGEKVQKGEHFVVCSDLKEVQLIGAMQLMTTTL